MKIKDFPLSLQNFTRVALKSIEDGKCIDLMYHGERRLVEVHAIGLSHKGKPCVRVYQVVGGSVFSDKTGWKMLSLEDIEEFAEGDEKSQAPRPGYMPNDKGMLDILTQVSEVAVPMETANEQPSQSPE